MFHIIFLIKVKISYLTGYVIVLTLVIKGIYILGALDYCRL